MIKGKIVYICSPFHGDVEGNIKREEEYSRFTYRVGCLPICVHIYLERATGLSEEKGDRKELLRLGREFVGICDEVWVFGDKISKGMKGEIMTAKRMGKYIRRFVKKEIKDERGKKDTEIFVQEMPKV